MSIELYEERVKKKTNADENVNISNNNGSLKFISEFNDAYLSTPVIFDKQSWGFKEKS